MESRCINCGRGLAEDRMHLVLNENAVAVAACPRCRPRGVDVFYVPQDNPPAYEIHPPPGYEEANDNEPRRRGPANQTGNNTRNGNNNDWTRNITLNLDNISRIEKGDRVELRNGTSWKRYEVNHHAKAQRIIKLCDDNRKQPFTHNHIVRQKGRVVIRDKEEFDQWNERIETPREFPIWDNWNSKVFWEGVKQEWIQSVEFVKTSLQTVGQLVRSAWEKGVSLLRKPATFLRDTSVAPFQAFLYWNWKHQEIEDKFANGEISEEQRREQLAHYKSALKKTGALAGMAGGGLACMGIRAGIMSYYGVGSAAAAVKAMCVSYPALAPVVAAAGGPAGFVAIGGLTLVAAGGIAGARLVNRYSEN